MGDGGSSAPLTCGKCSLVWCTCSDMAGDLG